MTFRNDHDAAHARIDSLERENRQLVEENARLRAATQRPTELLMWQPEVHPATVWVVAIFGLFTAVIAGAVVAGY